MIKLREVHTKVVSKAIRWMKGDQSKWMQVHTWRGEEMKRSLKTKVYARGFHFSGRDAIDYVVRFKIY